MAECESKQLRFSQAVETKGACICHLKYNSKQRLSSTSSGRDATLHAPGYSTSVS